MVKGIFINSGNENKRLELCEVHQRRRSNNVSKVRRIKERWKCYFGRLFDESHTKDWNELSNLIEDREHSFVRRGKWCIEDKLCPRAL